MTSPAMAAEELELLNAWRIGQVYSIETPETGTINRTLLVESAGGSYVLRAYRHAERAPVEREHAAIAHVRLGGLPAMAPIALPGGATILERGGRCYALFPRAPGRQLAHGQLTPGHIAAMGTFLARTHAALRGFPLEQAARRECALDRAATLAGIERLQAAICARPALDEFDEAVLWQLAGRRDWIARAPLARMPDLSVLGEQLIHGDFQHTNLFFAEGQVVAIIDWDQTYVAAREWEITRALDLICHFELEACHAFLAGYRAYADLDPAAMELAATGYALMRAHDLWLYQAIYVDGNQRVRRFVAPGPFVPLIERWAELNDKLRWPLHKSCQ
jgi:homoserine kinase type II